MNGQPVLRETLQEHVRFLQFMLGDDVKMGFAQLWEKTKKTFITEFIQLQAMQAKGIFVDEDTLDRAIQDIAQQNGFSVEQLKEALRKRKISWALLQRQVRIQLGWGRYLRTLYNRDIQLSGSEIDKQQRRFTNQLNKEAFRIASLVFYPAPEQRKKALARLSHIQSVVKDQRSFRLFSAELTESGQYYTQNSDGSSWSFADDLDPAVAEKLGKSLPGTCSLVAFSEGVGLFFLLEKKRVDSVPSTSEIHQMMEARLMEQLSRRELLQLRKGVVIRYLHV